MPASAYTHRHNASGDVSSKLRVNKLEFTVITQSLTISCDQFFPVMNDNRILSQDEAHLFCNFNISFVISPSPKYMYFCINFILVKFVSKLILL